MKTKRIFSVLAVMIMVMVAAIPTQVMAETRQDLNITVNGKVVPTDLAYISQEGRTMIPVTFVAKELGLVLEWEPEEKIANFTGDGYVLAFKEGLNVIFGNGYEYDVDTPPVIKDGRMFISVNSLGVALYREILWNPDTRTVIIDMENKVTPTP